MDNIYNITASIDQNDNPEKNLALLLKSVAVTLAAEFEKFLTENLPAGADPKDYTLLTFPHQQMVIDDEGFTQSQDVILVPKGKEAVALFFPHFPRKTLCVRITTTKPCSPPADRE